MNPWNDFLVSLKYDPSRLIYLDVSKWGLPKTNLYFYLDYLNHKEFSGNKIRKLFGTLNRIRTQDYQNIITVGGNYSNYLFACSFLPKLISKNLIVIIKGHEPKQYGYTLRQLQSKGVQLHFYPRETVKNHLNIIVEDLKKKYPNAYFMPEGGSNEFAHEGFEPLITEPFREFDTLCTPVGTLGTYKGIEKYLHPNQVLKGYAAHLDYSLRDKGNINFDYAFGGFAKLPKELLSFCDNFRETYSIELDPIYTSKMMYGIFQDIKSEKFQNDCKIVAIHTGGLQGWEGFREK